MKQTKKSDNQEPMDVLEQPDLETAQKKSLDDCAVALQSITELEKLAVKASQPNVGNVLDAKDFLRDALAYLAIFASKGGGSRRIRKILSKYGLEDWF